MIRETLQGNYRFSKPLFTVDKKHQGFKIKLHETSRPFKLSEVLKVRNASDPISQSYIDINIETKERTNNFYKMN